jgi:hypothetical protein
MWNLIILEELMIDENENTVTLDEKTIERILMKIILLEKMNLKTKEFPYSQMVKRLQALIEEEVECY